MSESANHWSQVRSVASVLCDGLLAVRAHRREQRRAAQEEAAVPPSWRVRPPPDPAPAEFAEPPRPAPPSPTAPRPPMPPEPAHNIEPLTLPPPVAPWDLPRASVAGTADRSTARPVARGTTTRSGPPASRGASTPSAQPVPPQTVPIDSITSSSQAPGQPEPTGASQPQPSAHGREELTQINDMVSTLVNLLGDVIGDVVGDALAANSGRAEQRQVQAQENLARSFEAALDRQEVRFRDALEQQAQAFAVVMERHAEVQAENLRTILREVLHDRTATVDDSSPSPRTAEVLEDLQETLRLGFGEVRTALDRHHRELMEVVRTEIRPLAKAALTHLTPSSPPDALAARFLDGSATEAGVLRAPPSECPDARGDKAQRARAHPEPHEDETSDSATNPAERSRHGPGSTRTNSAADTGNRPHAQETSR